MNKLKRLLLPGSFSLSLLFCLAFLHGSVSQATASATGAEALQPVNPTGYIVLAWNDLGMHCYNNDFADIAILPPYNTLWAQVVKLGDPPQLVTSGVDVSYAFADNTYSVGKTNFWTYAQAIFKLGSPLPDNVGLKGKGLSGSMDLALDHFVAEGIPLTEYSDSAPTTRSPYQLAQVTVKDSTTHAVLAQIQVVAPISSELTCDNCHSDTGDATVKSGITPTGNIAQNILLVHDKLEQANYPAGHTGALMDNRPVLCADCHSDNALGLPGVAGVESLSNAMHTRHSGLMDITPDTQGCYNCHPGPATQCLRDVMSQDYGMTCVSCHGDIARVATNPNPWLNEPRCDTCHGINAHQNKPLFRFSTDHGGIYCEACHDSTHAIATSRESNDALKFIALQGHDGTLQVCTVCHTTDPVGEFNHGTAVNPLMIYMPLVTQ
jgi:hypothetical protein